MLAFGVGDDGTLAGQVVEASSVELGLAFHFDSSSFAEPEPVAPGLALVPAD